MPSRLLSATLLLLSTATAVAQDEPSSLDVIVDGLEHMDGFYDLYWDAEDGRLLLDIDRLDEEFIYVSSMARGVGSNDLGLDRGQLGDTRLVSFQRSGPRILMVQKNLGFRATSDM